MDSSQSIAQQIKPLFAHYGPSRFSLPPYMSFENIRKEKRDIIAGLVTSYYKLSHIDPTSAAEKYAREHEEAIFSKYQLDFVDYASAMNAFIEHVKAKHPPVPVKNSRSISQDSVPNVKRARHSSEHGFETQLRYLDSVTITLTKEWTTRPNFEAYRQVCESIIQEASIIREAIRKGTVPPSEIESRVNLIGKRLFELNNAMATTQSGAVAPKPKPRPRSKSKSPIVTPPTGPGIPGFIRLVQNMKGSSPFSHSSINVGVDNNQEDQLKQSGQKMKRLLEYFDDPLGFKKDTSAPSPAIPVLSNTPSPVYADQPNSVFQFPPPVSFPVPPTAAIHVEPERLHTALSRTLSPIIQNEISQILEARDFEVTPRPYQEARWTLFVFEYAADLNKPHLIISVRDDYGSTSSHPSEQLDFRVKVGNATGVDDDQIKSINTVLHKNMAPHYEHGKPMLVLLAGAWKQLLHFLFLSAGETDQELDESEEELLALE